MADTSATVAGISAAMPILATIRCTSKVRRRGTAAIRTIKV
jgi:hypothetical protein